jgi:meiotically up-regulated gene 157 (Mug157) protein
MRSGFGGRYVMDDANVPVRWATTALQLCSELHSSVTIVPSLPWFP